jgi:hypothetical protein
MEPDHARLERQAAVEARVLARRLRGLPVAEIEVLTKTFVSTFLHDLLVNGDIDVATVLGVVTASMDLAIDHQAATATDQIR